MADTTKLGQAWPKRPKIKTKLENTSLPIFQMDRLTDLLDEPFVSQDLEEFFGNRFPDPVQGRCQDLLVLGSSTRSEDALAIRDDFNVVESVRLFVWERLNTGHWRDMDPGWHRIYSVVHLLKIRILVRLAKRLPSKILLQDLIGDLVKICDVGILLGSPLKQRSLETLATYLSSLHEEILTEEPGSAKKRKVEQVQGKKGFSWQNETDSAHFFTYFNISQLLVL